MAEMQTRAAQVDLAPRPAISYVDPPADHGADDRIGNASPDDYAGSRSMALFRLLLEPTFLLTVVLMAIIAPVIFTVRSIARLFR